LFHIIHKFKSFSIHTATPTGQSPTTSVGLLVSAVGARVGQQRVPIRRMLALQAYTGVVICQSIISPPLNSRRVCHAW